MTKYKIKKLECDAEVWYMDVINPHVFIKPGVYAIFHWVGAEYKYITEVES